MDMAMIQGTITGLKVAGDIAKGLLDLKSLADVQGKVIELQSAILSAQSSALAANAAQSAMVDEIGALKEEVTRIKAWESQKERYQLEKIWENGAVAYALKKSMSGAEPPHWICTKCYEDGFRGILNPRRSKEGYGLLECPNCNSEIHNGTNRDSGEPAYATAQKRDA